MGKTLADRRNGVSRMKGVGAWHGSDYFNGAEDETMDHVFSAIMFNRDNILYLEIDHGYVGL